MNNSNRSLFVMPITPVSRPVSPGTTSWTSNPTTSSRTGSLVTLTNSNQGKSNMIEGAKKVWNSIPDDIKQEGSKVVVETVKRKFSGTKSKNPGNSGRPGHSSGYSLSKAPNPLPVTLDSGITPNTYTTDYITPVEDSCSVLHLSAGLIQFPTSTANLLYQYFNQVAVFDLQTKAQANIGFNLNINTDFSAANILNAMNALIGALQIYFFYTSLISYHSDPVNKNQGMIALRQSMTPQMIEDLSILGRRLADTPVPPRFLELIRYMSGTYSSGPDADSPLIKIVPHYLNDINVIRTDVISAQTANLNTAAYNTVYTLLRRAVPQWSPKVLYDVPPTPMYDKNFVTLFANLPFTNYTSGYNPIPLITSSSDVISYNSFTNTLDGIIYAMCGAYNSTTPAQWIPGLISPPGGLNTVVTENSRRSYYVVSGTFGFYVVKDYPFLVRARQETYYNNTSTTTSSGHLFGAVKCLNVTADTIRETTMKAVDYLMSADTIKTEKQSNFGRQSTSNRKN